MQTACLELMICNLELVMYKYMPKIYKNDKKNYMQTACLELVICNLELVMCRLHVLN